MKFSIVTLSYNQALFVERAIRSVLDQQGVDIEYIVVDPGSSDESRRVIGNYASNIEHVVFEPDDGPADGLNKGFSHATGEIMGFLNADDEYLPNSLSKVAALFNAQPAVDVIHGHARVVNKDGDHIRNLFSDYFDLQAFAYGTCLLVQPSTFFRRRIWEKTRGFNKTNKSNWDAELWNDMADAGAKFLRIEEFLSAYRVHSNSITGSMKLDARIRSYYEDRFERIMGRKRNKFDNLFRVWLLMRKYFMTPSGLKERLLHGPVYGAASR